MSLQMRENSKWAFTRSVLADVLQHIFSSLQGFQKQAGPPESGVNLKALTKEPKLWRGNSCTKGLHERDQSSILGFAADKCGGGWE
jgi:hypothetical protein